MSTSTASTAPSATSIPDRVAELRELAATDPVAAQDTTWAMFQRLGAATATDRDGAADQLADLFGCGTPSKGIDGPTDGILVAPLIHRSVDGVLRGLTRHYMPWSGKSFDLHEQSGTNRLVSSVRVIGKLLWPSYKTRAAAAAGGRLAFDFETRIERGAAAPEVDVFVIDYEPVQSNPDFIIRKIRDELVEIVPGTHLGRILYRTPAGYSNVGYFALRTDVS
jgi:hypothetical protein